MNGRKQLKPAIQVHISFHLYVLLIKETKVSAWLTWIVSVFQIEGLQTSPWCLTPSADLDVILYRSCLLHWSGKNILNPRFQFITTFFHMCYSLQNKTNVCVHARKSYLLTWELDGLTESIKQMLPLQDGSLTFFPLHVQELGRRWGHAHTHL